MEILFLHGLSSYLHSDRREILEQFGQIHAPVLDYLKTPTLFNDLLVQYQSVDAIIGSSAGGLVGYYMARKLQKPCLLFNPALPFSNMLPFSTEVVAGNSCYVQVFLGMKDEVVPYQKSLEILTHHQELCPNMAIHLEVSVGHSYPIEVFSAQCDFFFKRIAQR